MRNDRWINRKDLSNFRCRFAVLLTAEQLAASWISPFRLQRAGVLACGGAYGESSPVRSHSLGVLPIWQGLEQRSRKMFCV